jgi:hypothetical protein
VVVWVFMVLVGVFLVLVAVIGTSSTVQRSGQLAGVMFGLAIFFSIFVLIFWLRDRSFIRRDQPADPARTMKAVLKAMSSTRSGYVLASLAPSARDREIETPDLAPVVTGHGVFVLADKPTVKEWLRTWACGDRSNVRWLKVKKVTLIEQHDRVADVEITLSITSWPQWANVVTIILWLLVRLVGVIIGLILWYSKRKVLTFRVVKRMIADRDGVWYLLDPDIGDGEGTPA